MLEPLTSALVLFSHQGFILLILAAVPCGLIAGALPGMGGKLSIVVALPFLLGVDPVGAAVFLLAMHAVVHTGGPIPSILIGVPGSGPDAATIVDGHPMARAGKAGRALGAALSASCVGGLVGAASMVILLPLVNTLFRYLGPGEVFLLTVLGITFIASASGKNQLKGLVVGCIGLLVSLVGMDPLTGVARFSWNQAFLVDGVNLICAIIGLFAIPEIIALRIQAGSLKEHTAVRGGTLEGVRDVWRHKFLTLRASMLGVAVGIIPGLGGEAASWMAYGHAVNSSDEPQSFGTGRVEGVIAPEAANNSKEGGSLLTTLFFGIPASSGMTVLLGAFLTLGITPALMTSSHDFTLAWVFIVTLVLANLLSVAVFLVSVRWLGLVSKIPGALMFPFVLVFAFVGCHLSAFEWQFLLVVVLFGLVGLLLKLNNWPRAPFAIGLVLGSTAEVSLHQAWTIWGWSFLTRPSCLLILALILAAIVRSFSQSGESNDKMRRFQVAPALILAAVFLVVLWECFHLPWSASLLPLSITLVGLMILFVDSWRMRPLHRAIESHEPQPGIAKGAAWMVAFAAAIFLIGIAPGLAAMTSVYFLRSLGKTYLVSTSAGCGVYLVLQGGMVELLGMTFFNGWVSLL